MAGRGPAPKPADKRARRNAGKAELEISSQARPANPPPLPGEANYLEETLAWYQTWATSPQATQFTATDWQRLHMLAPIVDDYFREPDSKLLAEIRLNEERLGATPSDRQRLAWHIVEETTDVPATARPRRKPDPRRLRAVR